MASPGGKSPAQRQRIISQNRELLDTQKVTCQCGKTKGFLQAYKCLYCREWFCFHCAEDHFGKTVQQWAQEQKEK